ncbi:hypothetical protein [Paenibacillus antri]|uniref:hypothetical protein n=1 Tax=Paenibacillus antri TaxID=2582848 RepID=UPI00130533B3|nr:hypothetical protein [Paenibacillus antri]
MEIRLGYVSTALALFNNTPSSTFAYKRFGALGPIAAFLQGCREAGLPRIDVMAEAKRKDLACFRLAEDSAGIRGIKRVEGAVLQWRDAAEERECRCAGARTTSRTY